MGAAAVSKTADVSSVASGNSDRPGGIPFSSGTRFGTLLASLTAGGPVFDSVRGALASSPSRKTAARASPAPAAIRQASAATGTKDATTALAEAMRREGVPASWQSSLQYIMNKESSGRVGVKNPTHSARGLFQLTAANYGYNPNGAASFGNGVEEAQGGIRYIKSRYGTAANAAAFWQQHQWY